MNNTGPSSLYFLHNSGLLMEFLFKGMLYCKIFFFLSKEASNRNKEKRKINVEIRIWNVGATYMNTYMD